MARISVEVPKYIENWARVVDNRKGDTKSLELAYKQFKGCLDESDQKIKHHAIRRLFEIVTQKNKNV
jgi:hypothetical protein